MKRRDYRGSRAASPPIAGTAMTMAALLAGFAINCSADINPARFASIADRNPFSLKPVPPTKPIETPPPVLPPAATVGLSGIISGFLQTAARKAVLDIIPPGKPMIHPVLAEGEKIEGVELVSIDVEKNQVAVKIGTLLTNITFTVAKATSTPPPGTSTSTLIRSASFVPGNAVPGAGSPSTANLSNSRPGISRKGVIMTGGDSSFQSPSPISTIPTTTPQQPQIDPAQAYINMKAQAEWAKKRGVVMPPAPSIIGVPN